MPDEQTKEWRKLTFSQRAGKAPLPEPLRAGELTKKFRNLIWLIFERDIQESIFQVLDEPITWMDGEEYWPRCFFVYHFEILEVQHKEIEATPSAVKGWFEHIILRGEVHEVLTLVEFCLRFEGISEALVAGIEKYFKYVPYYIDRSGEPVCIIPTTSEEMKENVGRSLDNINNSELTGAKSHLRNSSQELSNKNYADSVRESINAVASAARQIDPKASKDLRPALDSLERSGIIKHRAFKEAFKKLYGYASDEQGIRKPLIEQEAADVGFDEAIFMYGACVSFVDYLVSKQRQLQE